MNLQENADGGATVLEICAGSGGTALGLESAGFRHVGLIEVDKSSCDTLRFNRPWWNVVQADVRQATAVEFEGVDLIWGGVPSPPFSVAGEQLGLDDERDVFPAVMRLIRQAKPRAVVIDTVTGFVQERFRRYRTNVLDQLASLGYDCHIRTLNASDFGICQSRPVVLLVGVLAGIPFSWPSPSTVPVRTAGDTLCDLMAAGGWSGAERWRFQANDIAPAIVGGSRKHGGADLGPSRTKARWRKLGVNPLSLADDYPERDFTGQPKLTLTMVARLQGFPEHWQFKGRKTSVYKQMAQALPPPVAEGIGRALLFGLRGWASGS